MHGIALGGGHARVVGRCDQSLGRRLSAYDSAYLRVATYGRPGLGSAGSSSSTADRLSSASR